MGDRVGFTPRPANTSWGVRASTGTGLKRSSGSLPAPQPLSWAASAACYWLLLRVPVDADDSIHLPASQHLHGDAGHHTRPLSSLDWFQLPGVQHLFVHTKVGVVFVRRVSATPVDPRLHFLSHITSLSGGFGRKTGEAGKKAQWYLDSRHPIAQKGASVFHVGHVVRVAQTALAAVILGGICATWLDRTGARPPIGCQRLLLIRWRCCDKWKVAVIYWWDDADIAAVFVG